MKHLTMTERCMIEKYIVYEYSFREIAVHLGVAPSTISREVKNNRTFISPKNPKCANIAACNIHGLCGNCDNLRRKCKLCKVECTDNCSNFVPVKCRRLDNAPFVCNSCLEQDHCRKEHAYYSAHKADAKSRALLSEARKSIHLSEDEVRDLNELVSPLIKNGQSLSHIYANHRSDLSVSRRTLYRYVDECILDARNIDLPRKVRYKKRRIKRKDKPESYPYKYREGRTYEDFKVFIEQHPDYEIVEMDTVKGKRTKGKCLLSMIFVKYDFMLLFLLEQDTQECVREVFDMLKKSLGLNIFRRLFPVILTDNGSEFKAPQELEKSSYGSLCTNIFYCDAMASWQKPHIERSHEFIRHVLPKGCSFDDLTQADITMLNNHINSVCRDSLGGLCPYDAAKDFIAKKLPYVLGLRKIPADQVMLRPTLISR